MIIVYVTCSHKQAREIPQNRDVIVSVVILVVLLSWEDCTIPLVSLCNHVIWALSLRNVSTLYRASTHASEPITAGGGKKQKMRKVTRT